MLISANAPAGSDTEALAEDYSAVTVFSLDPDIKEATLPAAALLLEAAEK